MAVSGLNRLRQRFAQLPKEIQEDVRDIVEETTLAIQRQAIQNAPAAGDTLATTYGTQKINTGINQFIFAEIGANGLSGTVGVDAGAGPLPLYVEVGTGISAAGYVPTLPLEWQTVARRYYINGKGTLIKQPYLLPAYFQHSLDFVPNLKKALEKIKL